ncbi:MAG: hypothetical protein O2884_08600 [Chloroflexi bacterium]|nr:hypothetical protein [Chloroflexota bacterium]
MAIMDKRTIIGEDFDLDQEAGTYLLTNQIDLGAAGTDPGNGQVVYLNTVVTEAFTDGGDSATLELRLVSDDTAAIHASTSTIHLKTAAMLKASLPVGAKFSFPLPVEGLEYEKFLGINAVVATAGFDTGMITAWLSPDPIGWKAHPDATN